MLLHWIACQAVEAKTWMELTPLQLLNELSHNGQGLVQATSAVTTRQCCQLLAGMLLGCFLRGRRSFVPPPRYFPAHFPPSPCPHRALPHSFVTPPICPRCACVWRVMPLLWRRCRTATLRPGPPPPSPF